MRPAASMIFRFALGLALAGSGPATAQESPEQSYRPGFAVCAAYYFLASRGHAMRDYERLYSAGEFSLNEATKLHGQEPANHDMEMASGAMMMEMRQDWREIAILDKKYAGSCEILLIDAEFVYE